MPRCRDCQQMLPRGFRCKDEARCERRREQQRARLTLFEEEGKR